MNSTQKWVELFKEGKWKECSHAIQKQLSVSDQSFIKTDKGHNFNQHVLMYALQNNIFVCDQLGINWESETECNNSITWAKSYSRISELFRFLRCQHICNEFPIDLILCVACNFMLWVQLKIDPFNQHLCQREALNVAVYSLKTVFKTLGCSPVLDVLPIEKEFAKLVENFTECVLEFTRIQCHLMLEIIALGFLTMLENKQCTPEWSLSDNWNVLNKLVDALPQITVHLKSGYSDDESRKNLLLIKFGWKNVAEIINLASVLSSIETLSTVVAICFLRDRERNMKENCSEALRYLNLIERDHMYPFLNHYLQALTNFNLTNFDMCLYHLQKASFCRANFFMQARLNTLKGQTLLEQDKPVAALEALRRVEFRRKEVRLPLCAYLMGKAFQKLGKSRQQTEIIDILLEFLSAEPNFQPSLLSPLSGMEHKLLLSAHFQPEVKYKDVLQYSAQSQLLTEPKKAAEKLIQLLHLMSLELDAVFDDGVAFWKVSELLHDTASALLRADLACDAQQICEAALQFHSSRFDLDKSSACDLSCLKEDVIGLILWAEATDSLQSSDVFEALNRCATLLQNLVEKLPKSQRKHSKTLRLSKALLARIYLHKALLNVKRKFEEDAVACFQRALFWNNEDPEVILHFSHHLLNANQFEESLALLSMYNDCKKYVGSSDSMALNYLLGEKMSSLQREEILQRLQSLA